jgi:hypothetical protein
MEIKAEAGVLLKLYEQAVPVVSWEELGGRGRIYTLPVVVEMMLLQRLSERAGRSGKRCMPCWKAVWMVN